MLNAVEVRVLEKVRNAIKNENGEFCFSNQVKVAGMNGNEIGGYLSQLSQKGYLHIGKIDEMDNYKVVKISEKAVKEYFSKIYNEEKDSAEAESSSLVLPDTCDNVNVDSQDDLSRSFK